MNAFLNAFVLLCYRDFDFCWFALLLLDAFLRLLLSLPRGRGGRHSPLRSPRSLHSCSPLCCLPPSLHYTCGPVTWYRFWYVFHGISGPFRDFPGAFPDFPWISSGLQRILCGLRAASVPHGDVFLVSMSGPQPGCVGWLLSSSFPRFCMSVKSPVPRRSF